ncbi:hypothetical protein K9L81_00560 [Candidatus Gracilibacteria bacterium]|nr:hypothetical protein [Candidatus Gracilibacteria bacterium]
MKIDSLPDAGVQLPISPSLEKREVVNNKDLGSMKNASKLPEDIVEIMNRQKIMKRQVENSEILLQARSEGYSCISARTLALMAEKQAQARRGQRNDIQNIFL